LRAANKKQKYDKISQKKMSISIEELCQGYPPEFCTYLNYVRALRFEDKPDYAYLRKLFRDVYSREGFDYDHVYDWTLQKHASSTMQHQALLPSQPPIVQATHASECAPSSRCASYARWCTHTPCIRCRMPVTFFSLAILISQSHGPLP
jgi:hypothetical protein